MSCHLYKFIDGKPASKEAYFEAKVWNAKVLTTSTGLDNNEDS